MVFGIILTLVYDLFWFWEKYDEYDGDGLGKEGNPQQTEIWNFDLLTPR